MSETTFMALLMQYSEPYSPQLIMRLAVKIMDKGHKGDMYPERKWSFEELENLKKPKLLTTVVNYMTSYYFKQGGAKILENLQHMVEEAAKQGIVIEIPDEAMRKLFSPHAGQWQL